MNDAGERAVAEAQRWYAKDPTSSCRSIRIGEQVGPYQWLVEYEPDDALGKETSLDSFRIHAEYTLEPPDIEES